MSENQFESKKKLEFEPAFAEFQFAESDEMIFQKILKYPLNRYITNTRITVSIIQVLNRVLYDCYLSGDAVLCRHN